MSFLIGNIDLVLKVIVGLASIAAAIMAIRYHYYATKERKQQIKFNIEQEKRNITQEVRNVDQEDRNIKQETRNIENNEKTI